MRKLRRQRCRLLQVRVRHLASSTSCASIIGGKREIVVTATSLFSIHCCAAVAAAVKLCYNVKTLCCNRSMRGRPGSLKEGSLGLRFASRKDRGDMRGTAANKRQNDDFDIKILQQKKYEAELKR